tara:strand:- start:2021 stop:2605 length:585 start_codon:yes stop_codon:yes gene_type:complete
MKKNRAWQRMLSGRRLNIFNPSPVDIEIDDIAHGLSFLARWNGQTIGNFPFSVAQHSILVERLFSINFPGIEKKWKMASLLHDAAEYVISDMISPLKNHLGSSYDHLDSLLTRAIHIRFGIPADLPEKIKKNIKKADKNAAWLEAKNLAGFSLEETISIFGKFGNPEVEEEYIKPKKPLEARELFLEKFYELYN